MNKILLLLAGATLYLTLSGFQCASSQMNSAELAIKNRNYDKAATALEEEVSMRPDNGRAWYLLGVARYELGEYRGMKDAFVKAIQNQASETGKLEQLDQVDIQFKLFNAWAYLYDSATVSVYKNEAYDVGTAQLDRAEYILAGMPAVIEVKSNIALRKENRTEANKLYHDYVTLVSADIKKGVEAGLALGMSQSEVLSALGKPVSPYNPKNFQYADIYPSGLAVYYAQKDEKSEPIVQGWKYYGGSSPTLYLNYWLSSNPIFNAALDDYGTEKYDDALELLRMVEQLDPSLEEVGSLIGQIYLKTGRTDEAKAMLVRKIQEEPDNPKLRITYGVLLHDVKEYNEAVEVLKEALKLDLDKSGKDYQDILYNLGAFYKNWGVRLENDASDKGPASDADRAAYEAKYREAQKYFSQLRTVRGGDEYELLGEIGNLQALLEDAAGLKETVKEFERLKSNDLMKNDGEFWDILSNLYLYVGESEKAAEAKAKAASLGH